MTQEKLADDEYRCEMCKQVFKKGWTDEEAAAEAEKHFGKIPPSEAATVCDDCYEIIRPEKHPDLVAEFKKRLESAGNN